MEKLYNGIRQFKTAFGLPTKSKINAALFSFSKRERVIFSVLVLVLIVSTLLILNSINRYFMVTEPTYGGSISEGVVGTPRFINPVLAFTDADQDLVSLVYSGLMRKDTDGNLVPDLAKEYIISSDGLSYTFTLKDDIYFHDGKPVTVDDVIFTIDKVKDSIIKSPHKANWDGVTVTKIDDKTVEFSLKQPYALFLENTTMGIMPAHLWSDTALELNTVNVDPVGSGPYMITKVNKMSSGAIESYDLKAFKNFALGKPYIKNISIHFYANEDAMIKALKSGEVEQISSITPQNADSLKKDGYRVESATLPRVFGLFFNQNNNRIFIDKTIVKAINDAIDKDRLVNEVLGGYGVTIDEPIPPTLVQYQKFTSDTALSRAEILQKIQKSLSDAGWTKNADGFLEKTTQEKKTVKQGKKTVTVSGNKTTLPLQFAISTGNAPELVKAANIIKENLADIGIQVEIKTYDVNTLNQDVIRPRQYDALLFGQIINNESDLFAFWHSSQRKDPGLNIALYTNSNVDKILEDAFVTVDRDARIKKYIKFESEVEKDMPAVFLYSPDFIYVVSDDILGLSMNHITYPSNRFLDVYGWYTEKYGVWKIFTQK